MARISVDNGANFVTPDEALQEVSMDTLVVYMDDDIREKVHNDLAPCTEVEFLTAYLESADDDLIIG